FGADFDASEIDTLDPALRDCLCEGMVRTLWAAIPDLRFGDFQIRAYGPLAAEPGTDSFHWLSLRITGVAPEPVTALIGMSVAQFREILDSNALAPARIERGLRQVLTVDAHYVLGSLSTSFEALRRIAVGDVVVLPGHPDRLMHLRIDNMQCGLEAT